MNTEFWNYPVYNQIRFLPDLFCKRQDEQSLLPEKDGCPVVEYSYDVIDYQSCDDGMVVVYNRMVVVSFFAGTNSVSD